MFTATIHGDPKQPVLAFSGSLTAEHCQEIHQTLLRHLAESTSFTLDLTKTDRADLSFVQQLLAVLKHHASQIKLAPLPDHLTGLLAAVGAGNLAMIPGDESPADHPTSF